LGYLVPYRVAKVSEDSVYDVLIFNAGDNFHSTSTPAAGLYVNIEYSLQALCPGHGDVSFSG
jgi:hypothetical protein